MVSFPQFSVEDPNAESNEVHMGTEEQLHKLNIDLHDDYKLTVEMTKSNTAHVECMYVYICKTSMYTS